jgi:hypothetical protein
MLFLKKWSKNACQAPLFFGKTSQRKIDDFQCVASCLCSFIEPPPYYRGVFWFFLPLFPEQNKILKGLDKRFLPLFSKKASTILGT